MQVKDLMTTEVRTCARDTDLATAALLMWTHDCGAVPVVARKDGRVTGMITDRDIAMAVALRRRAPEQLRVGDVIDRPPVTVRPEVEASEALGTLARERVRRVPVVDDAGRAVGILSLNDLLLRTPAGRTHGHNGVTKDDMLSALRAVSEPPSPDGATDAPDDDAPTAEGGLTDVPGLKPNVSRKLEAEGIRSLSELAVLEFTPDRRRHIAERTGLTPAAALRFAGLAGILRLEGMTERHARVLITAGIDSYEKLRTEKKERLARLLSEVDPAPEELLAGWIGTGPLASAG